MRGGGGQTPLEAALSDTQKGNPNGVHYGAYLWQIITLNYSSVAPARPAELFPCASN